MQAINQGVSTQTATATVNIVVRRNENGPVFTPNNIYVVTVEDTIPLGSNITQLTATDADNVSSGNMLEVFDYICTCVCMYIITVQINSCSLKKIQ